MARVSFRVRVYRLWTYDVWGNARDGFEVNDRYDHGELAGVRCRLEVFNAGTPHEFHTHAPTDRQLSRLVGGKGLSWDGESDHTLYAEFGRNGKPACELEFVRFVN